MPRSTNLSVAAMGIDIGKNSFHVVGLDQRGAIVVRQRWTRSQIRARLANMPPCLIGMEACVGAHHLSRRLHSLGHDARLMPAKYVKPYRKGQKNDFRDAEAIAEAVQRPTMKFVATKTADQLDLQALHRVRERLVSQRTGITNQIRAFLLERGVAMSGRIKSRAIVTQKKTGRPVQFEITEQTRDTVSRWIDTAGLRHGGFLFPSRICAGRPIRTRQYARLVSRWISSLGLDPARYGTHSLRRTKPTLIYRRTGNLRAVQLLLGHTKLESTVRYLGIEVEDALAIAEQIDL